MITRGNNLVLDSFQTNKALTVDRLVGSLLKLSVVGWRAVQREIPFSHISQPKTVNAGDTEKKEGKEKCQYNKDDDVIQHICFFYIKKIINYQMW